MCQIKCLCSAMIRIKILTIIISSIILTACQGQKQKNISEINLMKNENETAVAVVAGGCFWCVETIMQRVKGVELAESGYTGGKIKNPTYKEVCSGLTEHAEAVKITYNPSQISYKEILEIFMATHDPTTLNRQGADIGTQYRSAIFYNDSTQKEIAENLIEELTKQNIFDEPIVTTLEPLTKFYVAEDYHQNYYNQNSNQPYCQAVISPKLIKFRKKFADKLKD
jgi:peptide-methionine (S)-S-oxide reductase